MADDTHESPVPAVMLPLVESHAACRHCGYDLHGLPADGRCPECGTAVASSLGESLLVFANPKWLESLFRGVLTLLIGLGLAVSLLVFLLFFSDLLPLNNMVGVVCLVILFIICWCAVGAWFLSTPDPSGSGEPEYGMVRRIARWAIVLGALQGLLDIAAIYWGNSAISFSPFFEFVFSETAWAQIIGVVGVFAHLQYLQMLTARTDDQTMSHLARSLKIALTVSWGILYLVTLLALLEFYLHVHGMDAALAFVAMVAGLFGGLFALFYVFFLFALAGTLAGVISESRKARVRPERSPAL